MKLKPAPSRCSSNALRTAFRVFMMFLLSQRATRSMYTGASSVASSSDICKGNPSLEGRRPQGEVVLDWPTRVVGAICPPVIP